MIHHLIRDHHVLWFVPAITKAEIFYKEMVSLNKIFLSLLFLFLIPGLCACGSGRKTAPATGPDVVPAEVSTEVPAAESSDNSVPQKEEASSNRSKSASEQAMDVVTELDAIGERMDGSDAFIVLDTAGKTVWKVPLAGMELQVPDFIRDAHGGIRALDGKEIIPGTGIVGLVFDAVEKDLITEAKAIADELHIDFLTLQPNDYLRETFDAMSYPTTYFINEKGEIMGEPLMGAKIKAYQDRM